MSDTANARGFSLIELMITLGVLGILAAITVPILLGALDRSRQRRTMADMRSVASATATMQIDTGDWATSLDDLDNLGYLLGFPPNDAWGTKWHYHYQPGGRDGYHLRSSGADGQGGPAAPVPWINEPYEPDLEIENGVFTKAPMGQ